MLKNEEMMNRIYAKISNVLLPTDLSPEAPPPSGFVSLMLPGETVNPADFDISPGAPNDKGRANLFKRMDIIPTFSKRYIAGMNSVSGMFERILGANVPADNPAERARKQADFDKAQADLEKYGEKYYEKESEYNDAFFDYLLAKITAEETPRDKKLQLEVTKAKKAVETAKKKWTDTGKKQLVEAALAEVKCYMAYSPVSLFAAAQSRYENEKEVNFVDGAPSVLCLPEKWATDTEDLSWANVEISQKSEVTRTHNSTEIIDSGWGGGFFFVSSSGSSTEVKDKELESINIDNCDISFEIARVAVSRDWFNGNLMSIPGVTMNGMAKGGFSAGGLAKANNASHSFIPTSIILARNIKISMTVASKTAEIFNNKFSSQSNTRVGIGPFCVNSSTVVNRTSSGFSGNDNMEILNLDTGDGMQIIGVICSILPEFPTANYTAGKGGKKLREYGKNEYNKLSVDMQKVFRNTDMVAYSRHNKGGSRNG